MATPEEIQQLTGKLMLDAPFRARFAEDPSGAARSVDIELTPEQEESFRNNLDRVVDAAAELEKAEVSAHGHFIAVFKEKDEAAD